MVDAIVVAFEEGGAIMGVITEDNGQFCTVQFENRYRGPANDAAAASLDPRLAGILLKVTRLLAEEQVETLRRYQRDFKASIHF